MKKLAAILLICVLTGSFLLGTVATAGQGNNQTTDKCTLNLKLPKVCNTSTCKLYVPYDCPWGIILVWDGDYCCDPSGGIW